MNVKLESDTMKPYFIAVERTGYSVYEHKATETGEKKGTPELARIEESVAIDGAIRKATV